MQESLKDISGTDLLSSLKELKSNENKAIARIVLYLSEIDSRKIYRDAGYSSLFTYCTQGLGYSEGAAFRRIQAARAIRENPEIYDLLLEGKITLCAIAEIAKVIKPENKAELLQSTAGKPKAEVQKVTAKYLAPQAAARTSVVKVKRVVPQQSQTLSITAQLSEIKSETRFNFSMEVDEEFMQLMEEAKAFIGPAPITEVLKRTLKEFVNKRRKQPRQVNNKRSQELPKPSRYIAKSTKFEVLARDSGQCTFVSPEGHRCCETRGLQFDHVVSFAMSGGNEAANLRLLCPAHNQLLAERAFGKEKIESHFRSESS